MPQNNLQYQIMNARTFFYRKNVENFVCHKECGFFSYWSGGHTCKEKIYSKNNREILIEVYHSNMDVAYTWIL